MRMMFIALGLMAIGAAATADERPRAPLGVGRELIRTQMAPAGLHPRTMAPDGPVTTSPQGGMGTQLAITAPAAADVRFVNSSTVKFAMSYWDGGAGKWTIFEVAPGASYDLTCAACGDNVQIAFHDGTTNRTVDVSKGASYAIAAMSNAWVLQKQTPPAR